MRIYTHEACIEHEVAAGHPERPDRLRYLLDYFATSGLDRTFEMVQATPADDSTITAVHPASHLQQLEAMEPQSGVVPIDPDTWLSPRSLDAARLAAGAVCDAADAVLRGDTQSAFCAVRPPGHHAETGLAMGFCLFNSIAIGARRGLQHVERVAVLDFDVHHGNGTVEIFKDEPRVLVCSSFQHPFYPNRYFDVERDHVVNTPLQAGTGSDEFRKAIERDWLPALEAHAPEMIFVSAGFDAHQRDPLASLDLTEADFAWVTRLIRAAAERYSGGRMVSALEGGYDLEALAASVHAHLEAIAE